MAFDISIPAFEDSAPIPREYTCEGTDISPEVSWADAPGNTKSLVLIMEDPDAPMGTFVHWVIYDIPASKKSLKKALSTSATLDGGIKQGRNDFGKTGYGGPCPPRGHGKHRYIFKLLALDTETLGLTQGATKDEVEKAVKGHVLSASTKKGVFGR